MRWQLNLIQRLTSNILFGFLSHFSAPHLAKGYGCPVRLHVQLEGLKYAGPVTGSVLRK